MRRFTALYDAIDATTSTNAKVAALAAYLRDAPPADAAWAVFFLTGRKLKRLIPSARLRQWAQEIAGIPEWLFRESYSAAGDFAELMALVLDTAPPGPVAPDLPLADWVEQRLLPLQHHDEAQQRREVAGWWATLTRNERFVLNKLITSEFRVGVAQTLVVRALAQAVGGDATTMAARLMGEWSPSAEWFESIQSSVPADADVSRPYPFFLASPLEGARPHRSATRADWLVEWKWDGIRAQLIRRAGATWLWSRGEELITQRFPEIAAAATHLPDGTCARRRSARVRGRTAAALRGAAAAHRPAEAGRADHARGPGRVRRLRPARARRRRSARAAARRAPARGLETLLRRRACCGCRRR